MPRPNLAREKAALSERYDPPMTEDAKGALGDPPVAREQIQVPAGAQRGRIWWRVALVVVLTAHVAVNVAMLWRQPDLYDQGVYLSTARFAADGLVPYRDFVSPYGPGLNYLDAILIWSHADLLVVHRAIWGIGRLAVVALLVIWAVRRDRLPAGVAAASVLLVAPVPANYVFPLAFVLLAVLAVDRPAPRYFAAFALLVLAVWFRWEYLAVLGGIAIVWVLSDKARRRPLVLAGLAAIVLALLPYILFAVLGGVQGLGHIVGYSLGPFARDRGLPYPFAAPYEVARDLVNFRPGPLARNAVRLTTYLLLPLLLLYGLVRYVITQRSSPQKWTWAQVSSPVALLIVWAVVSMFSLRVRSDLFHAAPLFVSLAALAFVAVPPIRRTQWVLGGVTALGLILCVATVPVASILPGPGVPGLDRMALVYPSEVDGLDQAIRDTADAAPPGSMLFVANTDNTYTYINAPFLYWVTATHPASRQIEFDPGYTDQDDEQQLIVERLCAERPVVVLWRVPSGGTSGTAPKGSERLDDFLTANYSVSTRSGDFTVLTPGPTSTC